jgi:hypothetical protein
MQKKFSVYPVQNKWTAIMSGNIYETRSKFNRPTRDRRYVKILALCLMYATASMMYPHTNIRLCIKLEICADMVCYKDIEELVAELIGIRLLQKALLF